MNKMENLCRQMAAEGQVLLENNGALPLAEGASFAYFGRSQKHYLMSGTGSGNSATNARYTTNILDSLRELGLRPDAAVEAFYDEFEMASPYVIEPVWAPPTSQIEPALSDDFVKEAAERTDTAIFQLMRVSGEGRDVEPGRGEFMLSEMERTTLAQLRHYFRKLIVIANISGLMDFSEICEAEPDALLLAWTGGMEGGRAVADVLTGRINPSGHLTDTVAKNLEAYPVHSVIAADNPYDEDIFIGYRYFETKAQGDVLYPFGYGLSYTEFAIRTKEPGFTETEISIPVEVENVGARAGKAVVQCYVCAEPDGPSVPMPARKLVAFAKSPEIPVGDAAALTLSVPFKELSFFDNEEHAWILPAGKYFFYIGENVRDARQVGTYCTADTEFLDRAVTEPFRVPTALPPYAGPVDFAALQRGELTTEQFVAGLSERELCELVRGEGMRSPKVRPGTGAAFGGMTKALEARGIPKLCCTDGPSGIRLEDGTLSSAMPSALCQASSWNEAFAEEMYVECGLELKSFGVDLLLGPGMNIHRYPLCGRNFEYYSEDPLVAGKMAAAACRGLAAAGVGGTIKHFLTNNHEYNRQGTGSLLSERAIREIYAKGFEIAIKESPVQALMTCYNRVNGHWGSGNRALIRGLIREELGFSGIVMTDWWAKSDWDDGSERWQEPIDVGGYRPPVYDEIRAGRFTPAVGHFGSTTNLAAMIHAGGDIYMVVEDAETHEDNLADALAAGALRRAELEEAACHIINFVLNNRK